MPKFERGARLIAGGAWLAAVAFAVESCTVQGNVGYVDGVGAPGQGFTTVDAGSALLDGAADFTEYCPSSQCPMGYTTCPTSAFRCDVNLLTDTQNCGACGVACPSRGAAEVYTCIEGRCVLACDPYAQKLDCNGIVDDGCESSSKSDDSCGACGNKCSDPDKPCADQTGNNIAFACGCQAGQEPCLVGNGPSRRCRDVAYDDVNCGACGNACDPTNDGGVLYDNTYYGCSEGKCGALKCQKYLGDCDRNLAANGCETPLWTNENCGACGKACSADQFCALQPIALSFVIGCVCDPGLTFCGTRGAGPNDTSLGRCYDLTSDPDHCGACDVACPKSGWWVHATPSCEFGACKMTCMSGWGDCNGNAADECETHTDSDPNNCGSCGAVCDAVAGQACVQGRCVVEPCAQEDGGRLR